MVAHSIGGIDACYGNDQTDSTKPQQETSVTAGMSGRRRWPPRGVLLGFWHVGWRIGTAYCYRRRHPRLLLRQRRGRRGHRPATAVAYCGIGGGNAANAMW
ncbi:Os12g0137966 [Oryza sativa Japonica Group]|uniref:Os12g0137966 protein n=1 Tax=Oryza sativa subsp. japonica TaxID=39947 RepID=A0A0P0Y6Y7_ORYSJ|nr:Os12g0137966 [Oryza sativa Japonica Group]